VISEGTARYHLSLYDIEIFTISLSQSPGLPTENFPLGKWMKLFFSAFFFLFRRIEEVERSIEENLRSNRKWKKKYRNVWGGAVRRNFENSVFSDHSGAVPTAFSGFRLVRGLSGEKIGQGNQGILLRYWIFVTF